MLIKFSNKLYLLILQVILFSFVIQAQNKEVLELKYGIKNLPFGLKGKYSLYTPKVALALSGGGVRGFAQIGILKALEENNIPIEYIAGTSMGSIVGGLYSAGYSVKELDSIAVNTEWNFLLSSARESNREELFIDQKVTEDKAIFSLRLKGLTPILPTSINSGERLANHLNLITLQAPLHVKNNFDELKYNFRAIATNLVTGEPVVLSGGSLTQAMRSSSSVTLLLPPVSVDSMILVDGGLVSNIPTKVGSDFGADFILAINTTSGLHKKDELMLPWNVADQIVSIPMKILNQQQLTLADYSISFEVDKASTDFTNIDSVIEQGYILAKNKVEDLQNKLNEVFRSKLDCNESFYKNVKLSLSENKAITYDSLSNFNVYELLDSIYQLGFLNDIKAEVNSYIDSTIIKIKSTNNPEVRIISLLGVTLIDKEEANAILSSLMNKPYNPFLTSEKIIDILRLYRKNGYSLAELNYYSFNEEDGVLTIGFDQGLVESVRIKGNQKTTAYIIFREFPQKSRTYFQFDKVEEGLKNLRGTQLFEDILINIEKEEEKNILTINLIERTSSLARFGFRIDNENKAQINIDLRDENLFGLNDEIGVGVSLSDKIRGYTLEHKSNRIFNTYFTYKFNAFYLMDDALFYMPRLDVANDRTSSYEAGKYRQIYYGGSLSLGTQVRKIGNVILRGAYQFDEIKNLRENVVDEYKIKIVNLRLSTTLDTQDKYPYTTKGVFLNLNYESAANAFGSDVGYTNIWMEYRSNFTFGVHTFSPKISMGFGDATLPLSQQYSLGGQNSFYGLREDEVRGRQLFLTSLEYRFKIPLKIYFDSYFKFRYDLGSTWEERRKIRFNDLKHGVGVSLSFDTPIGPADFSLGRSFVINRLLKNSMVWGDVMFYFSIGFLY